MTNILFTHRLQKAKISCFDPSKTPSPAVTPYKLAFLFHPFRSIPKHLAFVIRMWLRTAASDFYAYFLHTDTKSCFGHQKWAMFEKVPSGTRFKANTARESNGCKLSPGICQALPVSHFHMENFEIWQFSSSFSSRLPHLICCFHSTECWTLPRLYRYRLEKFCWVQAGKGKMTAG